MIKFVLPYSGDVESNQLAVLQMVLCMERDMTDLKTLLPFVHPINPFDAELPVGQVYMSFYSAAVVTKHDVGTKQVISNIRVAILPSTDIGLF